MLRRKYFLVKTVIPIWDLGAKRVTLRRLTGKYVRHSVRARECQLQGLYGLPAMPGGIPGCMEHLRPAREDHVPPLRPRVRRTVPRVVSGQESRASPVAELARLEGVSGCHHHQQSVI